MVWLKKNFLFTLVIALLAGAFAVQTFFILGARATAVEKEAAFDRLVEEYRSLTRKEILPHQRNVILTNEEIERQREELAFYHAALEGEADVGELFAGAPTSRTAAFFEIESFVEDYRRRFLRAEINYSDDERFGFDAYASAGPEEARIPEVHRHRVIVAHILDTLIETRPETFHGIQRPGAAAAPDTRRGGEATGGAVQVMQGLSLATPEIADALPFQVSFTGYTSTFRDFATRISEYELPLVIRQIQATAEGAGTDRAAAAPRRRAPAPEPGEEAPGAARPEAEEPDTVRLVDATPMRFTVAMEYLDVKPLPDNQTR